MTDAGAVITGLVTNPAYGIPLLLLGGAAGFWLLWPSARRPPLFHAIGPDRSWIKSPLGWAEEGAAADRIAPAIAVASSRVREVLRSRYRLIPGQAGPFRIFQRRYPAEARALLRLVHALDRAGYLASLAEAEDRRDFLARWRRPRWRRRSRSMFASVLPELETMLPGLEAGA